MLNIILVVCALLVIAAWLILPGESSAEQRAPFWGVNYAHRGLHTKDKSIPENSIAAFTAAIDEGYGIELDIQLSKDGEVVVFHDDELMRVCGVSGRVDDYTYEELCSFRLLGTEQKIPLLWDVIDLVAGKIPLVIELKTGPRNKELCTAAWRVLRTYDGDFCIESFDPRIVRWWKKNVPGVLRGQLAATPKHLDQGAAGYLIGWGLSHFLGRPQFIAYQKGKRPLLVRFCFHFAMTVLWTANTEEEGLDAELENDSVIFEFYLPEPRFMDAPGTPPSWPEGEEYRF